MTRDSDVGLAEDAGTAAEPRSGGSAGRRHRPNPIGALLMIKPTQADRDAGSVQKSQSGHNALVGGLALSRGIANAATVANTAIRKGETE